eukprot:CAMPEP_0198296030 /NCGR_PEP_ID=MMETSP1449-20131203/30613_1 /TAXON_ID=420275 /ORGANISM="Attheya septentrionalis, Strain CCMP2084" /LENGTH=326 /DNA_ID=CAMNT_0043996513 /DNA_START=206 /DNA_END=1183 /DNA_ORIENTATION=+
MDLDSLFINTDYKTVTVTIPCLETVEGDEHHHPHQELLVQQDEEKRGELRLDLACSVSASTDFDLTGQILWPVSVLLGHYLASPSGRALIDGNNVVELGAGCGLPGLVAAHFCRQAIVTDGNEIVVNLLQQNCTSFFNSLKQTTTTTTPTNGTTAPVVTAQKLLWGDRQDLSLLLDQIEKEENSQPQHPPVLETSQRRQTDPVNVIIAADVVQWVAVLEPLLHTVKALLWRDKNNKNSDPSIHKGQDETPPVFVLGIVNRAKVTWDKFFQLAHELGFTEQKIDPTEYLEGGVVPASCREYGGRETHIYHLYLTDFSKPPVLLFNND